MNVGGQQPEENKQGHPHKADSNCDFDSKDLEEEVYNDLDDKMAPINNDFMNHGEYKKAKTFLHKSMMQG